MAIGSAPVGTPGTGSASSGTTITVTISAPTSGNSLFAMVGLNGTNTVSSISSTGATWAKLVGGTDGSAKGTEIWSTLSGGSGTTVTINSSGTLTKGDAIVAEWSGVAATTTDVATAVEFSNSSSTPKSLSITTTNATDLILISYWCVTARAISSGPTQSFTGFTSPEATFFNAAYRVTSATVSAIVPTWTLAGNTSWICYAVAVKGTVTGGLRFNSGLAGIGASGPFFQDPLTR